MQVEEVRAIIRMTLDELEQRQLLKHDNYEYMLEVVGARLLTFFSGIKDKKLKELLDRLADDPYIEIIFFQYRDDRTLEWIAEYYDKDVSTIKRNKKRLITKLFYMIRDS